MTSTVGRDVSCIVAMTRKGVIGNNGSLPWHIPEELSRFRELTMGHSVIMGLNTFNSLERPLIGRKNIVLDHQKRKIEGVETCANINEAMERSREYNEKTFVIGGASVYEQMLPRAQILHVSLVKRDYEGVMYFPDFSLDEWRETESEEFDEFTAKTYQRVRVSEHD